MITQKELQNILDQFNGIISRLDARLKEVEKKLEQPKEAPKKRGRPKKGEAND